MKRKIVETVKAETESGMRRSGRSELLQPTSPYVVLNTLKFHFR